MVLQLSPTYLLKTIAVKIIELISSSMRKSLLIFITNKFKNLTIKLIHVYIDI